MIKKLTVVVLLCTFFGVVHAQEEVLYPNAKDIVKIELWTLGVSQKSLSSNIESNEKVKALPEELTIALDSVDF